MGKQQRLWLRQELPRLTQAGVIDELNAARLDAWCAADDKGEYSNKLLTTFATLGAGLIVLGVLLVLAFNWSELPRALRLLLALTPLATMQALGAYTLIRKRFSPVWREAVSTGLVLAIGAALALVSQIYQLPGDIDRFLLVWAALALPLLYLFEAVAGCLLYLTAITVWAMIRQLEGGQAVFFWIMFLLVLPRLVLAVRKAPAAMGSLALLWMFIIDLAICLGLTLEKVMPGLWMLEYAAFFAALYLAGSFWFDRGLSAPRNPLRTSGFLGTWILTFLLTYSWPWEEIGWYNLRTDPNFIPSAAVVDYVVLAVIVLSFLALLVLGFRQKRFRALPTAFLPLLLWPAYYLVAGHPGRDFFQVFVHLGLNLAILAVAVYYILDGYGRRQMAQINGGILLLVTQIALRFIFVEGFFEHLLVRGFIFIAIGAAFLAGNALLVWRFRKEQAS